jgi:hypothetical protein
VRDSFLTELPIALTSPQTLSSAIDLRILLTFSLKVSQSACLLDCGHHEMCTGNLTSCESGPRWLVSKFS